MNFKLQTVHRNIYPKKKKKVVFVRLELMIFMLQHDALPTTLCRTHSIQYS